MRLLVIACTQRKADAKEPIPAIDRYQGPSFQTLRKYLREAPKEDKDNLRIVILSAEFGLIGISKKIPNYNRKMDANQARKLKPSIIKAFDTTSKLWTVDNIFLAVGPEYLNALPDMRTYETFERATIRVSEGKIGERLQMLKRWLNGELK